ncbi:Uncharacterized conserved protein YecE, DUF72 family [Actinosynnema pretiosum]|nr:Uncharacterized conserved protein YecE, DUF72 family [Actinosynnema pretiosum]
MLQKCYGLRPVGSAAIRVGTSGWTYPEWRGDFYPARLAQRRELEHLAGRLASVEVNGSFYGDRTPRDYRSWANRTPEGFTFAVKGPRSVTHVHALRDVKAPLDAFSASGPEELGAKLGPILWQLPPSLPFDARLADFLALLPEGRHAVEPRHPSFTDPAFRALLERHGVALVLADAAGAFPEFDHRTADFHYVRLHGERELYRGSYPEESLKRWADRVSTFEGDTYVYFDNTMDGAAPHNAETLAALLGTTPTWAATEPDPTLF